MFTVYLTNEEKITYSVFSWLRKKVPNVRIETLRQISLYIARSYGNLDIVNDLSISYNDIGNLELFLWDGVVIEFSPSEEHFGFVLRKKTDNVSVFALATARDVKDLSTAYVMGFVSSKENGVYMVTSRLEDTNSDKVTYGVIDYYHDKDDFLTYLKDYEDEEKLGFITSKNSTFNLDNRNYFDVSLKSEVIFDCFDGYMTEVLSRIDLLGKNLERINSNKLVRVRGE